MDLNDEILQKKHLHMLSYSQHPLNQFTRTVKPPFKTALAKWKPQFCLLVIISQWLLYNFSRLMSLIKKETRANKCVFTIRNRACQRWRREGNLFIPSEGRGAPHVSGRVMGHRRGLGSPQRPSSLGKGPEDGIMPEGFSSVHFFGLLKCISGN